MRKFNRFAILLIITIAIAFSLREYFSPKSSRSVRGSGTGEISGSRSFPSSAASSSPFVGPSANPALPANRTALGSAPGAAVGQLTPSYLNPPPNEHQEDLENVQAMLRNYRTVLGENPVGTNAEIMRAVRGGNPRQINVGPPEGQPMNDKGELVDFWGTPYFFHQLAKDHMEIRSAGPDRIMWTEDDIVGQ